MQKQPNGTLFTLGLAIFSMLFGAGNIIYPIKSGAMSGDLNYVGILGFLLTGALLPILGLVSMILFDGNFKQFFLRLGRIPSFFAMLFCMLVVGPFLAMPRCITVPYDMISVFLPTWVSLPFFSSFFCFIVFMVTYRENRLLDLLGKVIGPLKIGSLLYIALRGLWIASHDNITVMHPTISAPEIFLEQVLYGFNTLDLLGSICFAAIIVKLLKSNPAIAHYSQSQLALITLKGGLIGSGLLTIMYLLYSYIGMYYGALVHSDMNGAVMFRVVALDIVGDYGAFIIIIAALMACLSTASALAVVSAEYLKNDLLKNRLEYRSCLLIVLAITMIISKFGLTNIINYGMPFITIGYPVIVSISVCNILYKLFDFQWIKLPVAATMIIMLWLSWS